MSRTGPGRRPGDPEVTKQAILDAAQDRFAAVGFERATIRSIAAQASVDPALVHHHFGTKQSLFATAHELPIDPRSLIESVAATPVERRGEALARAYVTILASGATGSPALSLIRAAATNEGAARMLREFVTDVFLTHADRLSDQDRPRLRLALIGSHVIGLVFGRSIVGVRDLAAADPEDLISALGPTFQRYLTDPTLFG